MAHELRPCSSCGEPFRPPSRPGRPPTRCETCRGRHRVDDKAWREVRALVLAEEPVCRIPGCGLPSTTVDHIVPLAAGGARTDRANLAGMCGRHNYSKGTRPLELVAASTGLHPVYGLPLCPCLGHGRSGCGSPTSEAGRRCLPCRTFNCKESS